MKKYILLAGVALATMTANNVMAYGNYSDVNVKANIEKLTHRTCTDLDFGTIKILPSANLAAGAASTEAKVELKRDGTVTTSGATVDNGGFGIMSVTGASVAKCGEGGLEYDNSPETITLKNGDSTLTVSDFGEYMNENDYTYGIRATLTIPDVITVEEGEYTGAFTVYHRY